jgi:hypothetical protein
MNGSKLTSSSFSLEEFINVLIDSLAENRAGRRFIAINLRALASELISFDNVKNLFKFLKICEVL